MRFLIDENLPRSLAEVIKSSGHDVLDVADSPLRGASDKALWERAAQDGRIIVTRDLDFPISGHKPAPFAVVLLRVPFNFTAEQITGIFKGATDKIKFEELSNKVAVISPGRVRISPLP